MADVLLVTTWGTACGIAEHAAMLTEAIEAQSPYRHAIETNLHPDAVLSREDLPPLVVLNYHAGLHSQWVPECIPVLQKRRGSKVLVIFHDTGVPNSPLCKSLHDVADAFVVHEPADDLPRAHYVRMGVSAGHNGKQYLELADTRWKAFHDQPVLGTVGFPFPWKCYDELAKVTKQVGWALLLIAPNATTEQQVRWHELNPATDVLTAFTPREDVVGLLSWCDATAFTYVCHNTGQSGAILQGIAARKPVIALKTCRQFRALLADPLGLAAIQWEETFEGVAWRLRNMPIQRVDPGIVALAEQESWRGVGRKYIEIYKGLLG